MAEITQDERRSVPGSAPCLSARPDGSGWICRLDAGHAGTHIDNAGVQWAPRAEPAWSDDMDHEVDAATEAGKLVGSGA